MAKMNQQSTGEVVMRLRKQEEEDRLKLMLQKLTDEMRAQHYGNNDISDEVVVVKEKTKDHKTVLSLPPSSTPKENTRSTPSLLVTEATNKNSGSTKNNKNFNEESSISTKSSKSNFQNLESKSEKQSKSLRSQVEQMSFRHQQVLNSIKNCQPDLLDAPEIVSYERSWSAKPDNFNVMSTARRVLKSEDYESEEIQEESEKIDDKLSGEINNDLTLSEGPLNTDSDSGSDYKKSNSEFEKSKSISRREFDDLPVRERSTPHEKVV